jgi:hypothetical protein
MALWYTGAYIQLCGFVDFDMAGDIDSRKSTTGYVFTLGGAAISWVSRLQKNVALSTTETVSRLQKNIALSTTETVSRLQKNVALSTTETEYVAAVEACKEMTWL